MGRGVSTPRDTVNSVFFDISWMGQVQEVDDNGDLLYDDNDEPVWVYDEMSVHDDWHSWVEWSVVDPLQSYYKSLYEVDKWLGREDHALLANNHCYIGVSSYENVACVWMVNRHDFDDAYGSYWASDMALAQAWCERVSESFRTVLKPNITHLGGFSNGEQVYRRVQS